VIIIWFNLWLLSNGHMTLIGTFETLEECQASRIELEQNVPGDYYCKFIRMEKV